MLTDNTDETIFTELEFPGYPTLKFSVGRSNEEFGLSKALKTLECSVKLLATFQLSEIVDASLSEILKFSDSICQMNEVLNSDPTAFKIHFTVKSDNYDYKKDTTACVFVIKTRVGSHVFGLIIVFTGKVLPNEDGSYELVTTDSRIEKRLVSKTDDDIPQSDLELELESVINKYEKTYSVVSMLEDKQQDQP